MMTISSEAGERLARAKAWLDELQAMEGAAWMSLEMARLRYEEAARVVADELIASGFHDLEGG